MNFLMIFKIAGRALARNTMRSVLTMLGIIIGVAAVIAMVAVGQGAKAQIESQIASIGSNLLMVFPGSTTQGGVHAGSGSVTTLTEDDAFAIQKELGSVRFAAPSLRTVAQVVSANQNWSTAVTGSTPDYFTVRDWSFESGGSFTQSDYDGATKVAVVGKTVATNLFGSQDPMGQIIRIQSVPFKIVGVLSPKGQSAMGQDQDDTVIIPLSTLQKRIMGVTYVQAIMVSANSPEETVTAEQEIRLLLHQRHHIPPKQDDDFTVRNMTDIAAAAEASSQIMTLLLGSIASVSLIVGGIGIMNIMLVSVTERTREIGIRMAVGAKSRDILFQFLVEAVVLSLAGGVLGVILGVACSRVISAFVHWPTIISLSSIMLASAFSIAIGVFFGLYPARRAASLDPIEALRYE
ncbi:MAG TPA: ABC transporter permease [Nitrospiria bacterium]|jgi:putative ABC transport system permease protein|nr:ABC transporter permease [Nitrospiria bacterium]